MGLCGLLLKSESSDLTLYLTVVSREGIIIEPHYAITCIRGFATRQDSNRPDELKIR